MTPLVRQIRAIHLCPAHHLRHSMRFNTRQLTTAVIPWNTLHIAPGATLTTTADLTEHGHRYGHTLTARLACTDIPDTLATAALALRITLIDGTTLLMGTHHRPHPFITLTQDLTGHPADPSAPLLTSTLTTATPLPTLIG